VTPSPNLKHQVIVLNIGSALRGFLETHRVGRVFVAPFDVVEPDVLYVSASRQAEVLTAKNVDAMRS
jgi:hypothetical protein